jgi:hypothetical protein
VVFVLFQLVDLRCVIARMLGLAIDTLAVPDYEVITRLEQLILANQANATTAFVLDSAIADLGAGFHAGYRGRVPVVGAKTPLVGLPAAPGTGPSAAGRNHRANELEARVY